MFHISKYLNDLAHDPIRKTVYLGLEILNVEQ
jgi:hypothetical protein